MTKIGHNQNGPNCCLCHTYRYTAFARIESGCKCFYSGTTTHDWIETPCHITVIPSTQSPQMTTQLFFIWLRYIRQKVSVINTIVRIPIRFSTILIVRVTMRLRFICKVSIHLNSLPMCICELVIYMYI